MNLSWKYINTDGVYSIGAQWVDEVTVDWLGGVSRGNKPVVVVAGGNKGPTQTSCTVPSPATAKNAIAVGAVNDGTYPYFPPGGRAYFSCTGPVDVDGDGHSRTKPDVVAPGTNVVVPTTAPANYSWYDGTSFSAPTVAGLVALMFSLYSNVLRDWRAHLPAVAKAWVVNNAFPIYPVNVSRWIFGDPQYGFGFVNFYWFYLGVGATYKGQLCSTGEKYLINYTRWYNSPSDVVFITLTWLDKPGPEDAYHDLDLRVYYDGRLIASSISFDETVEKVAVTGVGGGVLTIEIYGNSIRRFFTEPCVHFVVDVTEIRRSDNDKLRISVSIPSYVASHSNMFVFNATVT
ncbi:MAG: S8 family serine peptidase, partial [Pyrobaculum sp.]